MSNVHDQLTPPLTISNPRKRKRGASVSGESSSGRPHPQSPVKNLSTSLYDHISHIWLEEDALKEFNKRNRSVPRSASFSPGSGSSNIPQRRQEVSPGLQRFARVGGPDLSDLRGYTLPTSRNSSSKNLEMAGKRKADPQDNDQSESQKSRKTDATGAYDRNFATCLAEQNVRLPSRHTPQPKNCTELLAVLKQKRPGSTDSNTLASQWETFLDNVEIAETEDHVLAQVFPIILGGAKYPCALNKLCTTWAQLFPDVRLKRAKPDFFDGLRPGSEYRLLRQQLKSYVTPADGAPLMPNFFTEIKGNYGTESIATRQALHDGTLGTQGVYQTQKVATIDPFDENSHVFSSIFVGTSLRLFAHFVSRPTEEGGKLHYHMCKLDVFYLDKSLDEFHAGITAFQNLRDHAATVRTELARVTESKLKELDKAGVLPLPLVAPNPPKNSQQ